LVSPLDKEFDRVLEEMRGSSAIGTTRRGIGPAYAMRALRLSPRVSDLLAGFDFGTLTGFYRKFGLDPAGLLAWAEDSKKLLGGITGDVGARVAEICDRGGSVLFESSQGTLLDLLHGTYPFVTSTHTVVSYIPSALGVSPAYQGAPLGVMKCYTTRVGSGPFPSEVKGPVADKIRSVGSEYGATTGRPRRVGWLDLVALRYAVRLNGVKEVAVSKLDVLSEVSDFKVCVAYNVLGSETHDFQRSLANLADVQPVYESPVSLEGARYGSELPTGARKFVDYVEKELGVRVSLLSHGEDRSRTIEL
jgi:adenylosuccinate synthase